MEISNHDLSKSNCEVAIEPRADLPQCRIWPSHIISRVIQGTVRIPSMSQEPIDPNLSILLGFVGSQVPNLPLIVIQNLRQLLLPWQFPSSQHPKYSHQRFTWTLTTFSVRMKNLHSQILSFSLICIHSLIWGS